MPSWLLSFMSSPPAQLVAFISLMAWMVFNLIPNWNDRKRIASSEVFDELCSAFLNYGNGQNNSIEQVKLEYAAAKFCKQNIHPELISAAFKSDHILSAIVDIRKISGKLKYENGVFVTKTKSGRFPSREKAAKTLNLARFFYVLFSVFLISGSSLGFFNSGIKVFSLLMIMFAVIFLFLSISLIVDSTREDRLARVKILIDADQLC